MEIGRMTPGEIMDVIQARQRQAMAAGWWAERFAREKRLKSLDYYLNMDKNKRPTEEVKMEYMELKATLGGE